MKNGCKGLTFFYLFQVVASTDLQPTRCTHKHPEHAASARGIPCHVSWFTGLLLDPQRACV